MNSAQADLPILVVGAGPAGLTAALELSRHGRAVRIIETRAQRTSHFKALSINTRTLELLGAVGVTERLLAHGRRVPAVHYRTPDGELFRIDYTRLAHRYNFMLALPQNDTEAIMENRLNELGVQVERGTSLCSFQQTPASVTALVERDGVEQSIDAANLIGADGAYSIVRETCGIAFPGTAMAHEWSLADVRMDSPWPADPANILLRGDKMLFALRIKDDLFRLGSNRPDVLQDLPDAIEVHEVLWQTQFAVNHRQAESHRSGRVFLAGDAAHVHAPMGARGMNMSIEDSAILARHISSGSPDRYSGERLQAGAAALRMIKTQTLLVSSTNPCVRLLRERLIPAALKIPAVNNHLVERMLGIGYA